MRARFLFPALLWTALCAAQEIPDSWLENLQEQNTSKTEDEDLLMAILESRRYKVNLNTCTVPDLMALPGVSPGLAGAIVEHRETTGLFQSVYELQTLEGMDPELYRNLEGFFTVNTNETLEKFQNFSKVRKGRTFEYLLLVAPVLQQRRGYQTGAYSGLPLRQWHRLQLRPFEGLRMGLNMENDAGEAFRWNSRQKGFDYYSGFVEHQGKDKRNKIILGDYMTGSGQGLVHGRGRGFGSQAWVGRVYSSPQSRVYRSAEENLFCRGTLVQHALGRGLHKAFFSFKQVGSPDGLHRTEAEYALKKSAHRMLAGQSMEYPLGPLRLGVQYLYAREKGASNFFGSLSHAWQKGNRLLFGEWALDARGNLSLLEGLVWSLEKRLDLSFLFRHYPGEQSNVFASGFSSFSRPENETGIYVSAEWRPGRKSSWRAYFDHAYRLHPSHLVSVPYLGSAYFVETERKAGGAKLLLRFREENGYRDLVRVETPWKETLPWKKRGLRFQMDWQQGEALHFRTRLELSDYRHGEEHHRGHLFFQELQWRPKLKRWYVILRYQYFFVPDYDARIYAYESDVLYAYSVPAFSGRGQRMYVVFRYPLLKGLDVWLKLPFTQYRDKNEIGNGNDLLRSDKLGEMKVMVRWGF